MAIILGAVALLLGAVYAQESSLPVVDLGYELYRASDFNVSPWLAKPPWLRYTDIIPRTLAASTIFPTSDTQHRPWVSFALHPQKLLLRTGRAYRMAQLGGMMES